MPFPDLPTLILSDTVSCIRVSWGVGAGGGRVVTSTASLGTFPAAVEPDPGADGEPFDQALEAYANRTRWMVQFQASQMPAGGLKPNDVLLWTDDSGINHVLTVTGWWPLNNQSRMWFALAEEKK